MGLIQEGPKPYNAPMSKDYWPNKAQTLKVQNIVLYGESQQNSTKVKQLSTPYVLSLRPTYAILDL